MIRVGHRSYATQSRQSRQVRKEATVTGSCVCSGQPVSGLFCLRQPPHPGTKPYVTPLPLPFRLLIANNSSRARSASRTASVSRGAQGGSVRSQSDGSQGRCTRGHRELLPSLALSPPGHSVLHPCHHRQARLLFHDVRRGRAFASAATSSQGTASCAFPSAGPRFSPSPTSSSTPPITHSSLITISSPPQFTSYSSSSS